jgi:hypothetical protein
MMGASECGAEGQASTGRVVEKDGREWFEVEGLESLPLFLMMVTSDRDHWMFIGSDGALSCGRKNPDHALLPYYTQDKLHDMSGRSGSVTLLRRVGAAGGGDLWRPLSYDLAEGDAIERKLRKTDSGDMVELEETHLDWQLRLTVRYSSSAQMGTVRRVRLENLGVRVVEVEVLDGLRNLLCPGLESRFQNEFSCLGDAYKQGEFEESARMGIYSLSSLPTDLAQPMEALRANAVWMSGADAAQVTLGPVAVERFMRGQTFEPQARIRGTRLAYLSHQRLVVEGAEACTWYYCADVDMDIGEVEWRIALVAAGDWDAAAIERQCVENASRLRERILQADGLQLTADKRGQLRHLSNTLFNLMRGGALSAEYNFPEGDLLATIGKWNREAAAKLQAWEAEHGALDVVKVWDDAVKLDEDVMRLAREYLPLSFSRRHGDPSRPWNRFSIELEDNYGRPRYAYQGNWRDIFQNWEALLQSYPLYLPAAINRFLNASSADGYNPYRVSKDGFEWEEPSAEDPWANIGYWGDHQIVYLLRLLESVEKFQPGWCAKRLADSHYVYADIPYRIVGYDDMLRNPRETIGYDEQHAARIRERVERIGSDGKLLQDKSGLMRVGLLEKLLVPMLAKLANFVPGAGIWMNTQRPEWNDANNALVGYGVSVVTNGYLYRYARFLREQLAAVLEHQSYELSEAVAVWLLDQVNHLEGGDPQSLVTAAARGRWMRLLGEGASRYRRTLYDGEFGSGTEEVSGGLILRWLDLAIDHLGESLQQNRRDDGLYHSYTLLRFSGESVDVARLYLMLEGQVSMIASGYLTAADTVALYGALRASDLYREDQDSYLLYPDRELPGFRQKNRIPAATLAACGDWKQRVDNGSTRLLKASPCGEWYLFHPDLTNASALRAAYAKEVGSGGAEADERCAALLEVYDSQFDHHAFTGRSGTFFAYEGLGSIYWHMVSKLGLALLESAVAAAEGTESVHVPDLLKAYREVKTGLGVDKPVWQHGAIPTDAYSHTPGHAGAQQPGMTGQVKEDILARQLELGVAVRQGSLTFSDAYFEQRRECLEQPARIDFTHVTGERESIEIGRGQLMLSICQVPVIYRSCSHPGGEIRVCCFDGTDNCYAGTILPQGVSESIFRREGKIRRLEVGFHPFATS